MQQTLTLCAWIAAIAILAVGFDRVEVREAGRLSVAQRGAAALDARIERARVILRDRVALRAAREDILSDIRAQATYGSGSDLGSMLTALDRSASSSGLGIVAIEPEGGVPATRRWLRSRSVKVVLRGTFGRLASFLGAFSRRDPLVEWSDVKIVPAGSAAAPRELVATFGALAYSVRIPVEKE